MLYLFDQISLVVDYVVVLDVVLVVVVVVVDEGV